METKVCLKCKVQKEVKDFYKDNTKKDKLAIYCRDCAKLTRQNDKERIKKYSKEYREKNREKIRETMKLYFKNNKEKENLRSRLYREKNRDRLNEVMKQWMKNNRDKINKQYKQRQQNDFLFKLKEATRKTIYMSIKRKKFSKESKTNEILGCTYQEFKSYLENQFQSWMNWDNYGNPKDGIYKLNKTWDIDHIIPISSAKTEEEIIKLNHYTNLQPLCSKVNRDIKKNKIEN